MHLGWILAYPGYHPSTPTKTNAATLSYFQVSIEVFVNRVHNRAAMPPSKLLQPSLAVRDLLRLVIWLDRTSLVEVGHYYVVASTRKFVTNLLVATRIRPKHIMHY